MRYGETLGAKMKAAKEALPALDVKHAVRSDMSIFKTGGAPEVHALLDKARPAKVGRNISRLIKGKANALLAVTYNVASNLLHRPVWRV